LLALTAYDSADSEPAPPAPAEPKPMRLRPSRGSFLLTTTVIGALGLMTAGCKTPNITGSGGALNGLWHASSTSPAPADVSDWRREVADAGERYRADPSDAEVALRYARALRRTGQHAQAAAVLQQASIRHPHDKRVLGDYGRALAENGQ